jgi:hypothetical protein
MSNVHYRPLNKGSRTGQWAVDEYIEDVWQGTTFCPTRDEARRCKSRILRGDVNLPSFNSFTTRNERDIEKAMEAKCQEHQSQSE